MVYQETFFSSFFRLLTGVTPEFLNSSLFFGVCTVNVGGWAEYNYDERTLCTTFNACLILYLFMKRYCCGGETNEEQWTRMLYLTTLNKNGKSRKILIVGVIQLQMLRINHIICKHLRLTYRALEPPAQLGSRQICTHAMWLLWYIQ